jgi:hypothetical protein
MAARSEAEVNSLLVYKSPAWKGGVHYFASTIFSRDNRFSPLRRKADLIFHRRIGVTRCDNVS